MLSLLLLLLAAVDARCWCATFIRAHSSPYIRKVNTGCNDVEMQKECMRAEWEMVDFVNAVMGYARTITEAHPSNDTFQEGLNHAALSHALEKNRPVPDCATGLATNKDHDGNEWAHIWFTDDDDNGFDNGFCYSRELLDECDKVKNGINDWVTSIMTNLDGSNVTADFTRLVRLRVEGSIIPTITCRTTTEHLKDGAVKSAAAAPKIPVGGILVLMLVAR
jgi:hypothetical protein